MSGRHYGSKKAMASGRTLADAEESRNLRASPIACKVADAWVQTLRGPSPDAVLDPLSEALDVLEKATRGGLYRKESF